MSNVVYLADDDNILRMIVHEFLEENGEGLQLKSFENGDLLFEAFSNTPCDAVIIDAVMPGSSGLEIVAKIRQTSSVPIIMLTSLDTDDDYVSGISQGVDVYLTKPFRPPVLMVHLQALLSRANQEKETHKLIQCEDLTIYPENNTVYCNGTEVMLTKTEFKLLVYLIESKGMAVSREMLLSAIWGYESPVETRAADDAMKRLRRKLADANSVINIEAIWGFGFKLIVGQG